MTVLPASAAGSYQIDPTHSRIGFVARHAMVTKVRGSFGEFSGSGHLDANDVASSSLHVEIDVASINTGNDDRDAHVRGEDFFDVEKYPKITFTSTEVEHVGGEEFRVTGDLTIKDVTKSVTFDVEVNGTATDPFGNERLGLEGSTKVNRKDFGLTWNAALEAGGVLVSEKVTLEFDVSAVKAAD